MVDSFWMFPVLVVATRVILRPSDRVVIA
jgi:hypothetical protein